MTKDIFTILDELAIEYKRIDHVPVYTSDQARALVPRQDAASAKNLFLKDKKGKNHFLLVFYDRKTLDFDHLAGQLNSTRLSLASPERLKKYLDLDPGAVSLLALINDPEQEVTLLIDRELWEEENLQCHPLVNTATLVISMQDIRLFLKEIGHTAILVDIP